MSTQQVPGSVYIPPRCVCVCAQLHVCGVCVCVDLGMWGSDLLIKPLEIE